MEIPVDNARLRLESLLPIVIGLYLFRRPFECRSQSTREWVWLQLPSHDIVAISRSFALQLLLIARQGFACRKWGKRIRCRFSRHFISTVMRIHQVENIHNISLNRWCVSPSEKMASRWKKPSVVQHTKWLNYEQPDVARSFVIQRNGSSFSFPWLPMLDFWTFSRFISSFVPVKRLKLHRSVVDTVNDWKIISNWKTWTRVKIESFRLLGKISSCFRRNLWKEKETKNANEKNEGEQMP